MTRDFTPIPLAALALGLAGLIPFWAAVVLLIQNSDGTYSPAAEMWFFTIYSTLIAGFLGGVRWGQAISAPGTPGPIVLTGSIMPSLVGLLALLVHWLGQPATAWAIMSVCYAALLLWDRFAIRNSDLPGWYGLLRIVLTTGVVLAHLAISFAYVALVL